MLPPKFKYAWALTSSWLRWKHRMGSLGRRCELGPPLLAPKPSSIHIGAHTMIHDRWSLVDLSDGEMPPANIQIGSWCRIQHDFQINARERVEVGDYCLIAPRVFIADCDHVMPESDFPLTSCREFRSKPVVIGKSCWLGVNAVILKGVTIGHHSIVGANSVVTRNVPPHSIVGGSPAKVLGKTGRVLSQEI